jgi:hypothetical protein
MWEDSVSFPLAPAWRFTDHSIAFYFHQSLTGRACVLQAGGRRDGMAAMLFCHGEGEELENEHRSSDIGFSRFPAFPS